MLLLQIKIMIKVNERRSKINNNRINSSNSNINKVTRITKDGAVNVTLEEGIITQAMPREMRTNLIIRINQVEITITININNPVNNIVIKIIRMVIPETSIGTPTKAVVIITTGKIIMQTSNRRTEEEVDQEDKEEIVTSIGK